MEPAQRKTTILLTDTLHKRLVDLARRRGVSMGHLIRQAVRAQYGLIDVKERVDAVRELAEMALPVGSTAVMKAESNPFNVEPVP